MYDSHLTRISNRPGEKLQVILATKLIDKFLKSTSFNPNKNSKSANVIEIGSGSGRMLPILHKLGFVYTAVEPTRLMRTELEKVARRSNIEKGVFHIVENSLPNLPNEFENRFDLAIALHVIEHAPNPYNAREWLDEIKRVLKSGGHLLVVTPFFPDYQWRFYDVDWSHSFPTTVNNLREILVDLDFHIIEATTIRGWSSNKLYSVLIGFLLRILPVAPLDYLAKLIFKQELLYSGFSAGFLRRNTFLIARKN